MTFLQAAFNLRMHHSKNTRLNALRCAALTSSVVLAACSGGGNTQQEPEVGVSMPQRLIQSRALDPATLMPMVTLSTGQSVDMRRVDDTLWSGTVQVLPGSTIDVDIIWISSLDEGDLELAGLQRNVVIDEDGTALSIASNAYSFQFDQDNDGVTNIDELEAGTNPFGDDFGEEEEEEEEVVPPPPPPETVDVFVPRIAQADAPGIDGENVIVDGDGNFVGEWADAVQVDSSGVTLGIVNLMIDQGADVPSGTLWRRWAAMHDGEYLYILVVVEDTGRRFGDGPIEWQDDSVELYLDGNNSQLTAYDNEDDQHLIIPLLEPGTNRSPNSNDIAGLLPGPNTSDAQAEVDFFTGPGIGPDGLVTPNIEQDVYEMRVELDSANIGIGRPFGFELQINDDDDGGERDSKWGWAHPARDDDTGDVDFTFMDPSFMGTMFLD